jgi:hypothetical protein
VGRVQGDQLLAPLQGALRAPGRLAHEGVQPGQDPAVLPRGLGGKFVTASSAVTASASTSTRSS